MVRGDLEYYYGNRVSVSAIFVGTQTTKFKVYSDITKPLSKPL